MKSFLILALFAASVAANGYGQSYSAPQVIRSDSYSSAGYGYEQQRSQIPITRFNHDIRGSLADSVSYETGNGISQSDNTQVVQGRGGSYDDGYGNVVQSDVIVTKNGAFSYTSPEGQHIATTWVADDQGFRADGAHLPRNVEMPYEHAEAHRLALASVGSSYGGSSYGAPAIRSSYEAPAVRSSYDAPAIRVQSYDTPVVRSSYDAPAIRVQSYDTPVRSSY